MSSNPTNATSVGTGMATPHPPGRHSVNASGTSNTSAVTPQPDTTTTAAASNNAVSTPEDTQGKSVHVYKYIYPIVHTLTYISRFLNYIEGEEREIFKDTDARRTAEWDSIVYKHLRPPGSTSFVYEHYHKVSLKKDVKDTPLYNSSKILQEIGENNDRWLCLFCMKDPSKKDLSSCVKILPQNKTTNGNTHLKTVHKTALEEHDNKKKAEEEKKMKGKTPKKRELPQATIGFPKAKKKKNHDPEIEKRVHRKIVELGTCGGFADTIATNPHLRKLIDICIENGHNLQNYQHLGIRKYVSIQCNNFDEFITKVSSLVESARKWWIEKTGAQQKFICVAHDVWDGIRCQINGVTIFFIHPETHTLYRIPIGMMPPGGKTGEALKKSCMEALKRVGITHKDLFRSVNDNCSTAKKTGRL